MSDLLDISWHLYHGNPRPLSPRGLRDLDACLTMAREAGWFSAGCEVELENLHRAFDTNSDDIEPMLRKLRFVLNWHAYRLRRHKVSR